MASAHHVWLALLALGPWGCAAPPSITPPAATVEPLASDAATAAPPVDSSAAEASDAGAQPAATVKTLFVAEQLVDCEGEGPMKCMSVREDGSDDFLLFYDPIEGFSHEAGFRYELKVEVRDVAQPPADGSSLRYRLISVVSKAKAPKENAQ